MELPAQVCKTDSYISIGCVWSIANAWLRVTDRPI